jgi:hypothetical protein
MIGGKKFNSYYGTLIFILHDLALPKLLNT